ncbi:Condensin complex subunit 3 [Auxenochlorella protothecoides]|uniref:Condensin complex subunit 3 n=1 Tax=Auxenochlorella protothecoides TaxID=3075 RepID=A0A087SKD4_AUXPR|nr:Condensin complex subunit 3 [Auxenochlorella protothecoides]KFM26188.1 Condensin complex subunit 3 [Auxenochlorella protothecoides]
MARERGSLNVMSVPVFLNEAQRGSSGAHLRLAKALWEVCDEEPARAGADLVHAFKLIMTCGERTMYVDRVLRFLATFAAQASDEGRLTFLEQLLQSLASLMHAEDAPARWRACQLAQALLSGLPADAGLSEDVADGLQAALLERAADARPAVRAAAARALARLPDPGEDGDFAACPITATLIRLASHDASREVRRGALASLPPCVLAARAVLERSLDPDDDVRRVAYLTAAHGAGPRDLAPAQRALLIRRGLRDRCPAVAAAALRLVQAWLAGCDGDPLSLLSLLDAHGRDAGELALRALLDAGTLNPVRLMAAWAEAGVTPRCVTSESGAKDAAAGQAEEGDQLHVADVGADLALAWCAAAASAALEALDAFLPSSWEEAAATHSAVKGEQPEAADHLLLMFATCLDTGDAAARRTASDLVLRELVGEGDELAAEPRGLAAPIREVAARALARLLRVASPASGQLAQVAVERLCERCEAGETSSAFASPRLLSALALALQALPPRGVSSLLDRALGDIAARHGVARVDEWLAGEDSRPCVPTMLCALGAWRHDLLAGGEEGPERSRARDEAGAALAAALGRLMVLGQLSPGRAVPESEALEALISLLGLAFDPTTEAAPQFRQTLTVALETLASLSLQAQSLLASALLPAARRAAAADAACSRTAPASAATAPVVMRFVAQLLHTPVWSADASDPGQPRQRAASSHESLALVLVRELAAWRESGAATAAARAYASALARLLSTLPLRAGLQGDAAATLAAAHEALEELVGDAAFTRQAGSVLAREARAAAARLRERHEAAAEQVDSDALQCAAEGSHATHAELTTGCPLPFGRQGAGKAAPRRASRSAFAGGGAGEPDADDATSDEDDDDEVGNAAVGPAPRRRLPRRSTTSGVRYRAASSESDGSEGEEDSDAGSSAGGSDGGGAQETVSEGQENEGMRRPRTSAAAALEKPEVRRLRAALAENCVL